MELKEVIDALEKWNDLLNEHKFEEAHALCEGILAETYEPVARIHLLHSKAVSSLYSGDVGKARIEFEEVWREGRKGEARQLGRWVAHTLRAYLSRSRDLSTKSAEFMDLISLVAEKVGVILPKNETSAEFLLDYIVTETKDVE